VFQSFNLFPHTSVMTMIIATHEMGFACDVANQVVFLWEGSQRSAWHPGPDLPEPGEAPHARVPALDREAGRLEGTM